MAFYDCVQTLNITLTTRLTDTSNTLIDNVFANSTKFEAVSGILINGIFDHQAILTIITNTNIK